MGQIRAAASGQSWASTYLNMATAGIQDWTVPATGPYRIECVGAQGGAPSYSYSSPPRYGRGAQVIIQINLTMGSVVRMLVGQMGVSYYYQGSGGGGTFVFYNLYDTYPIVAAGGGAGGAGDGYVYRSVTLLDGTVNSNFLADPAYDSYSGTISYSYSPGYGGSTTLYSAYTAGAGGGWLSNGQSPYYNYCGYSVQGGNAPRNGGTGGAGGAYGSFGGGGGAAGQCSAGSSGAGGGYSGGNAGTAGCCTNEGSGGASYWPPNAHLISATAGVNSGNGYVTITQLF